MAQVCDIVLKRILREKAQLDLDSRQGMYGMGLADRICTNITQADATNLALLDLFGRGLDRGLNRDAGIARRTFKDVDCLSATQVPDGPLDRRADTFRDAVGPRLHAEGAFDAEHDLGGILRILFEVVLDQMQRICLRRAAEHALHASQSSSPRRSPLDGPAGSLGGSWRCCSLGEGCTYTVPKNGTLLWRRLHDFSRDGIVDGRPRLRHT